MVWILINNTIVIVSITGTLMLGSVLTIDVSINTSITEVGRGSYSQDTTNGYTVSRGLVAYVFYINVGWTIAVKFQWARPKQHFVSFVKKPAPLINRNNKMVKVKIKLAIAICKMVWYN